MAPALPRLRGRDLAAGLTLLPEQRLTALSDEQAEMVVGHWIHETTNGRYAHILEYGGAGDKGRDRAAFEGPIGSDPWDNYQCKQYGKKLQPADLWLEFGKLVFYVSRGDYSRPRQYFLVAPKGMGPSVLDLLGDHERLRAGLKQQWERYCGSLCPLTDIEDALDAFEFPEFVPVAGERIVRDLADSRVYPYFFGGGLTKPRPADREPPEEIDDDELTYIKKLVAAYDEHSEGAVPSLEVALEHDRFGQHLRDSRRDFYCAESLREFSKDVLLEPDAFERLQDLVYDGVRFTIEREHPSGFARVLATCEQAVTVQLDAHPLNPAVEPADRAGVCHQLANERDIGWVR